MQRELSPEEVAQARSAALRAEVRDAVRSGRRTNAIVMFAVGVLFSGFALACFAGAISTGEGGLAAFGAFWTAIAGLLLYIGVRYRRAYVLEDRLRAVGVPARAVVVAFHESSYRVDGQNQFRLTLQIQLQGRAPYDVVRTESTRIGWMPVVGLGLPVLVDPEDPSKAIVDWSAEVAGAFGT